MQDQLIINLRVSPLLDMDPPSDYSIWSQNFLALQRQGAYKTSRYVNQLQFFMNSK